jgi:hypothetical protein
LRSASFVAEKHLMPTGEEWRARFLVFRSELSCLDSISGAAETEGDAVMGELAEQSKLQVWQWRAGSEAMGDLPARMVGRHERP